MKLGLIVPAGMAFAVVACGGRTSGITAGASGSSGGSTVDVSSGAAVSTGNGSGGTTAGLDAGLTDVAFTLVEDDGSPGDSAVVAQPVAHLTATEYANTVNDLLSVPPSAQSVPLGADGRAGSFAIGGPVSDVNVQQYHDSAVAIASQVVSNLGNLLAPVKCDPTTGAACAATFINAFAPLAFRHGPVDAATIAGLNQTFGIIAAAAGGATTTMGFTMGLQAVIEQVLQSPYFLYHLEVEDEAKGVGQVAVTGYSMANRLSYLLWGSMPDGALFSAAAGSQLATPAQVSAQATRMVADPKAKIGLRNFHQQWLTSQDLPSGKTGNSTQVLPNGTLSPTSLFGTASGQSFATEFSPALQQAIVDSFNMQVDSAMWAGSNVMKTLLTGTTMYANEVLAPLLGVAGVTGPTLVPVQVDPTRRIGILSHPLLMATYSTTSTSHAVKRGRYILDQIICQPEENPPPGVPPFTPPAAGMSLRQRYELLTATGPYSGQPSDDPAIDCANCHARMDPVGFLFEPYDTIGQFRTIDDYGAPVDLTNITIIQSLDPSLNGLTASSMQLAQKLANSDQPNLCLMSNLYRFMAHRDDGPVDAPAEAELDAIFDGSGENLTPVLVALTQTSPFLERLNVP